jgi:hypothetical protein
MRMMIQNPNWNMLIWNHHSCHHARNCLIAITMRAHTQNRSGYLRIIQETSTVIVEILWISSKFTIRKIQFLHKLTNSLVAHDRGIEPLLSQIVRFQRTNWKKSMNAGLRVI